MDGKSSVPDFLYDIKNEYMTKGAMSKKFLIGEKGVGRFIEQRILDGRPIQFIEKSVAIGSKLTRKFYQIKTVCIAASVDGLQICCTEENKENSPYLSKLELISLREENYKIKRKIKHLKLMMQNLLLEKSEILSRKKLKRDGLSCGIYFLINNQDIVYCGQSVDIGGRIWDHIKEGTKEWTHYAYVEIDINSLSFFESLYIEKLKPAYNIASPIADNCILPTLKKDRMGYLFELNDRCKNIAGYTTGGEVNGPDRNMA